MRYLTGGVVCLFSLCMAEAWGQTGNAISADIDRDLYDDPYGNTHVVCQADPTQSYELYIPSSVPGTGPNSILYVFDPGGDGKSLLLFVADAAAQNGWIVAASNNSKNGPWVDIFEAQDAILLDTETRLDLDPSRRFATGFSGGARASLALAFRYPEKICGVLCMGAGWPINTDLEPSTDRLIVRILIGTEDGNYDYDVPETEGALVNNNIRCQVDTYNAGHVWPPTSMVSTAASWLNENAETYPNDGPAPESCGSGSLVAQPPVMPDGAWIASTADAAFLYGNKVYEDFSGAGLPITHIEWWGFTAYYHYYAGYWLPRDAGTHEFTISIHSNDEGVPGPAVYYSTVSVTPSAGPSLYKNNYPLKHYKLELPAPIALSSGWIGIESVSSEENCFFWLNSDEGNGSSLSYVAGGGGYQTNSMDLAISLAVEDLICDFTVSPPWGKAPHLASFEGSVDGDLGEDLTFTWDFGDGTIVEDTLTPQHLYEQNGVYTVTLTVTTPTREVTYTSQDIVLVADSLSVGYWGLLVLTTVALALLGALRQRQFYRRSL